MALSSSIRLTSPDKLLWPRPPVSKQDLRDYRQYFVDLIAAVKASQAAGQADNSEEMIASVRTALQPKYGTWASFPNGVAANVEGVIRWSKM